MSKARDDLGSEVVQAALSYEPNSGKLYWRAQSCRHPQWNAKFAGREAGSVNDRGYVIVGLRGRDFRAHRLAWVIVTGAWPVGEVDHRNMDRADNRWDNLRVSTHSQNNINKTAQSNNTSGYKGVSFCKITRSWSARMMIDGKYKVLGRTASPESAYLLYCAASKKAHGQFSNTNGKKS